VALSRLSHRRRIRAPLTGEASLSAVGDFRAERGPTGRRPLSFFAPPESSKREKPVGDTVAAMDGGPEGWRPAVISIYAKSCKYTPPKSLSGLYYVAKPPDPLRKCRVFPGPVAERRRPVACHADLVVLRCGCGKSSRLVWSSGCGRRDCPRCGPGKGRSAAKRVAARFLADRRNMQYTVFTVPPAVRDRWQGATGYRRLKEDLRNLVKALESEFGLEYAYCRIHPTGEDGRSWHPHINLLWVQKWGSVGRFSRRLLSRLREVWADVLGVPDVVVHTSYRHRRTTHAIAAYLHTIEYVERAFPGWRWQGLRGRWFRSKRVPSPVELESPPSLFCAVCGSELEYRGDSWASDRLWRREIKEILSAGYLIPADVYSKGPVRYG